MDQHGTSVAPGLRTLATRVRKLQALERHLVAAGGDRERGARVGAQVGRVAGQRAKGKHRAPRPIGLRTYELYCSNCRKAVAPARLL